MKMLCLQMLILGGEMLFATIQSVVGLIPIESEEKFEETGGGAVNGLTCTELSKNSTVADHYQAWTCEQLKWRNALAKWKKLAEQKCNVSDAKEYWRTTFKCPDFSSISCFNKTSRENTTDLFNCSIAFCNDGMYEDNMVFLEIWRQHLTTHQTIMTIYKSKLINCGIHNCLNSDAITLDAWNTLNIKYFNLSTLLSEAEERVGAVKSDIATVKMKVQNYAAKAENQFQELENRNIAQTQSYASLSSALNSTNAKISDLETGVNAQTQSYASLSSALNSTNKKVGDLESDVNAQTQSYASLSSALNGTNAKISDIGTDAKAQFQRLESLSIALNETNTKIGVLQTDVGTLTESCMNLSSALTSANMKITNLINNVSALTQSYASLLCALNTTDEKVVDLEAEVIAQAHNYASHSSALNIANAKIIDLETDVSNDVAVLRRSGNLIKKFMKLDEIAGRLYYFGDIEKSWQDAQNECKSNGGDLVAKGIRESEVFNKLNQLAFNKGISVWIGLNDIDEEGRYVFVDGVVGSTSDSYWSSGQPDNYNNNDDCGILVYGSEYKVSDLPCANTHIPLCEYDLE